MRNISNGTVLIRPKLPVVEYCADCLGLVQRCFFTTLIISLLFGCGGGGSSDTSTDNILVVTSSGGDSENTGNTEVVQTDTENTDNNDVVQADIENTNNTTQTTFIGNTRVSSILRIYEEGSQSLSLSRYDDAGWLVEVNADWNGEPYLVDLFDYDQLGRIDSMLSNDLLRGEVVVIEYLYDDDQLVSRYLSDLGQSVIRYTWQYHHFGGQLVGRTTRVFDPPTENPSISDGTVLSRRSYTYDESGYLIRINHRSADGLSGYFQTYLTTTSGKRISSERRDLDSNLIFTEIWGYENALCRSISSSVRCLNEP